MTSPALTPIRGLTWDHPRGVDPLRASIPHAAGLGLDVRWDAQSLEGFESTPLAQLARDYDLIVIDHPHVGDVQASGAFVPADVFLEPAWTAALSDAAAGASGQSYRYGGHTWALPLDAATQTAVLGPAAPAQAPALWDDALRLAGEIPMLLPAAGPHPLLSVLALARAAGDAPGRRHAETLLEEAAGERAIEYWLRAVRASAGEPLCMNPIHVLEALSDTVPLAAFCPLVYQYVSYARAGQRPTRLRFADAPRLDPGGPIGSVLGGTGLAVTRRAPDAQALRDYCRWLLDTETQRGFIARHGGQPGLAAAWADPQVNAACGDFYAATRATLDAAWVRPRRPGFTSFQDEASRRLREAVGPHAQPLRLARELNNLYLRHCGAQAEV